MFKKSTIFSLVVGLLVFIGVTAFSPPEKDCGCPPGWTEHLFKNANNPNLVQDRNGDRIMCYKNLPEKAKGNNLGNYNKTGRNWKDNNQPCDEE